MYPQDYDNLIFEGRKACMLCAPPLPVEHPRVVRLSREEVARRHHSERLAGTSFYFYRSYVATWEIRNGRFYLQALYGDRRLIGEEPLSADWYTGPLRVPHGFELQRSRGIMKLREFDVDIAIVRGEVRAFRVVSNMTEVDGLRSPTRWPPLGFEDPFPGPESS